MSPLSGTIRATGHVGGGGPVQFPGSAGLPAASDRVDPDLRLQPGVFSSRQIEQRCREDLGFMYVAGRNCPNFRVLSDFRKDHGEFFRACFKQTVQLAMGLGLVSLGHVSLDGSKFKANSSKHKAMSYGRLKQREQELCEEIEALTAQAERCDEEEDRAYQERTGYELPEDLQDKKQRLQKIRAAKRALERREAELRPGQAIGDKKQISFADTDARIMKGKGGFEYGTTPRSAWTRPHR